MSVTVAEGEAQAVQRRRLRPSGWAATVASALVLTSLSIGTQARPPEPGGGLPTVALKTLPAEAQATHALILKGGPFPYSKDGTVFGNRERLLPLQPRGYYREYTVRTPGLSHRGARRIVCGGRPPTSPAVCYYTRDHYASFARIAP